MRKFITSEQLRRPKYVIPIIALPFVLILGYVASSMTPEKKINDLESMQELNANLPQASVSNKAQDKLNALLRKLESREKSLYDLTEEQSEKESEENTEEETEEHLEPPVSENSLLEESDDENAQALRALQEKYFGKNTNDELFREPKDNQANELSQIRAQLARMDSAIQRQQKGNEVPPNDAKEKEKEEMILLARKANELSNNHFNTLMADRQQSFISAIIDQAETVVSGSRIRVRLLDDIFIGDKLFKKGEYLYGLVSGFSAQRVHVKISSVLYGNEILRTNLTIYDNDGMAGLYVPHSDFREMLRYGGSQIINQSFNIDNGRDQLQQFASQMGEDLYRTVTNMMTRKIRQNKAKVKYATVVYLINNDEINK